MEESDDNTHPDISLAMDENENGRFVSLTIKTLDAHEHKFDYIDENCSIKNFKEYIADTVGVVAQRQRLIYLGRVLSDEKKLKEYSVNEKVVHLVERHPPADLAHPDQLPATVASSRSRSVSPSIRRHRHINAHRPNGAVANVEQPTSGVIIVISTAPFPRSRTTNRRSRERLESARPLATGGPLFSPGSTSSGTVTNLPTPYRQSRRLQSRPNSEYESSSSGYYTPNTESSTPYTASSLASENTSSAAANTRSTLFGGLRQTIAHLRNSVAEMINSMAEPETIGNIEPNSDTSNPFVTQPGTNAAMPLGFSTRGRERNSTIEQTLSDISSNGEAHTDMEIDSAISHGIVNDSEQKQTTVVTPSPTASLEAELSFPIDLLPSTQSIDAVVGREAWYRQVPLEWVPTITSDTRTQQQLHPIAPFSDAYLSTQPPKKRRLAANKKPDGTIEKVISDTLKKAITVTGVQPKVSTNNTTSGNSNIAVEAARDVGLQAAIKTESHRAITRRIQQDPDFDEEKFRSSNDFCLKD